jgi:pimeloyl-ACP methyl ester carboxylesterase
MADHPLEERGLRIAGADSVTIAADAFGSPEDAPIIFMHGGGQSRSAWRGAARRLATQGWRALTIDLRGHGDSDWAPDGNYSFDRYTADIEALVAWLGAPAVLVGASLGGHAALMAAASRPQLVRGLALADVTPWVDEDHADGIRAAMRLTAEGFDSLEEAAATVDRLRGTAPRGRPEGLRPFVRQGEDGRLYWLWDPRFLQDRFVRHGGEGGMFAAAASRLEVPTLLMRAEYSNIVDPAHVERFKEVLPALRYVEIKGVGHMVTGDANDAYAEALIGFVNALEPPVPSAAAGA